MIYPGRPLHSLLICASLAIAVPAAARENPFIVVVDAGHGGHDPGSLSPTQNNGAEKLVTLAIARAVSEKLRLKSGVRIILTRSDDRFLSLVSRRKIAEAQRADLFISIHADSAPSAAANGASVYTLGEDGLEKIADRMAAGSDLDGIRLSSLDNQTATILGELKQRVAMNSSATFASTLAETLSRVVPVRSRFHQTAHFAVLKARGIPTVLIETGYMTSPNDAKLLFSSSGQKRIGGAIAKAILVMSRSLQKPDDEAA